MSSSSPVEERQERISVSSDVLARLGEELITNHIQALAELIKNAYDADATLVKVQVDTNRMVTAPDGSTRRGLVTVADNGFGMDEATVRRGWLRVSASRKRAMKAAGEKTPKRRTPLGDKGLGRLGAQRLGDRVRIRTRPELPGDTATTAASVEHDVAFAFSSFASELDVDQLRVPWTIYQLPAQRDLTEPWPIRKPTGTVLEISGLSAREDWSDLGELERSLSLLVNPFKGLEKFHVAVTVDGHELNLLSVANEVRNAALARVEGTFDGDKLVIEGRVRTGWFNVRDKDMQQHLAQLVEADKGAGLQAFAIEAAKNSGFEVSAGKSPWLLSLSREITFAEGDLTGLSLRDQASSLVRGIDPAADAEDGDADAANGPRIPVDPGDFLFELDVISRRIGVARAAGFSALDRQAAYSAWLNERGGIHVYRDGFRINLGQDFMALGEAFSSSSNYYGLRPQNVIGYFEISAEHNPGLEETTDREGFRETPEVVSFRRLIGTVRDEVNDVLGLLGRSTNGYLRSQMAPQSETTEDLADQLNDAAREASSAREALTSASVQIKEAMISSGSPPASRDALEVAQHALAAAETALLRTDAAGRLGTVVRNDVADLNARVEEYAQLIGLGLVAETLAHELNHVTARLGGQVAELRRRGNLEPWAKAHLQNTRSALDALQGHLRHLDPMLRYARSRRESMVLAEFAEQMADYHGSRLRAKGISIEVAVARAATVEGNRGRLMQVFDNLVLNSEYWLEQSIRAGRVAEGRISVRVVGPVLAVSDNGPGVDKGLEKTIFEPFVTAKADRGRGLGLFICRQLLDLDGASIRLSQHRNPQGRLDTFEVIFDEQDAELTAAA